MTTIQQPTVTTIRPSTCVDTAGAVDATVRLGDVAYTVTLCPRAWDGELARWGDSLDCWLGGPAEGLTRDHLDAIESVVRDAAVSRGLS